jgi:hypothetical protein
MAASGSWIVQGPTTTKRLVSGKGGRRVGGKEEKRVRWRWGDGAGRDKRLVKGLVKGLVVKGGRKRGRPLRQIMHILRPCTDRPYAHRETMHRQSICT